MNVGGGLFILNIFGGVPGGQGVPPCMYNVP